MKNQIKSYSPFPPHAQVFPPNVRPRGMNLQFKTEAAMTKWVKKTGIKFATNLPLNGDLEMEKLVTRGMVTATVGRTIFVFYPLR